MFFKAFQVNIGKYCLRFQFTTASETYTVATSAAHNNTISHLPRPFASLVPLSQRHPCTLTDLMTVRLVWRRLSAVSVPSAAGRNVTPPISSRGGAGVPRSTRRRLRPPASTRNRAPRTLIQPGERPDDPAGEGRRYVVVDSAMTTGYVMTTVQVSL